MAWGFMFLMLPFTCVYYPVSVLPSWLQIVAWVLPPTYVFEGMRALLINNVFRADLMLQSFALNAVIFAIGVAVFMVLLRSARREGTLLQGGD
jgi:ABC-2 type transport system permease protein